MLLSANVGEGLFFAGQSHVAMKVIAAPHEHGMITSNPEEIEQAKLNKAETLKQATHVPPASTQTGLSSQESLKKNLTKPEIINKT